MASTNEDVVVLASARQDDGRVLLMRHLPDRGTIELGWWQQEAGAVMAQLPVLELCGRGPRAGGPGAYSAVRLLPARVTARSSPAGR